MLLPNLDFKVFFITISIIKKARRLIWYLTFFNLTFFGMLLNINLTRRNIHNHLKLCLCLLPTPNFNVFFRAIHNKAS